MYAGEIRSGNSNGNYEKIRYYLEHTDYSQRTVAQILGVSRNTVKKYWEGQTVPWERKHIQLYLDEFCYRFNRRSYHENLFERLALACVNCPECRLEQLLR